MRQITALVQNGNQMVLMPMTSNSLPGQNQQPWHQQLHVQGPQHQLQVQHLQNQFTVQYPPHQYPVNYQSVNPKVPIPRVTCHYMGPKQQQSVSRPSRPTKRPAGGSLESKKIKLVLNPRTQKKSLPLQSGCNIQQVNSGQQKVENISGVVRQEHNAQYFNQPQQPYGVQLQNQSFPVPYMQGFTDCRGAVSQNIDHHVNISSNTFDHEGIGLLHENDLDREIVYLFAELFESLPAVSAHDFDQFELVDFSTDFEKSWPLDSASIFNMEVDELLGIVSTTASTSADTCRHLKQPLSAKKSNKDILQSLLNGLDDIADGLDDAVQNPSQDESSGFSKPFTIFDIGNVENDLLCHLDLNTVDAQFDESSKMKFMSLDNTRDMSTPVIDVPNEAMVCKNYLIKDFTQTGSPEHGVQESHEVSETDTSILVSLSADIDKFYKENK